MVHNLTSLAIFWPSASYWHRIDCLNQLIIISVLTCEYEVDVLDNQTHVKNLEYVVIITIYQNKNQFEQYDKI